jgi:endonuclease YncB( thermonuclease family)
LVEGSDLSCVGAKIDDYGRTIATCFDANLDLNKEMVLKGLAWAFLKYSSVYEEEQGYAKRAKIGVWQAETQPAWEFRAERWSVAKQVAPDGCPIKVSAHFPAR